MTYVPRLRLIAVATAIGAMGLTPVLANAKTGTIPPPSLLYTIGGPDHAYVYPSGDEVVPGGCPAAAAANPSLGLLTTDTCLAVSDIGNDKIDEFDVTPGGSTTAAPVLLWQDGSYGTGTNQFNNPRDVGVDSAGDVFVADAMNSRIVKLNPFGVWQTAWSANGNGTTMDVPIGVSVVNNVVYVADTGHKAVRAFNTDGMPDTSIGVDGTIASSGACVIGGLRDVNRRTPPATSTWPTTRTTMSLKFSSTGACITTWGTTGIGSTQFRALYGITVATDPDPAVQLAYGTQELYIADANNNRVDEYSTGGTWIATIGVAGTKGATGTLGYTRRVAVDAAGNVWIADLWDWRVEEWSRTNSDTGPYAYVQQIGTTLPAPTSTAVFNQVNQVAFETTGGVVTAIDAMNTVGQQLTRFTAGSTPTLINTCGLRAEGTAIPGYNWPRGVAVDPATGNLWTLDTKQYRVEILSPTCKGIKAFGTHGTATDQFNWPYAIAIRASDEVAWIADTWNNRIVSYNVSTMQPIAISAAHSFNKPGGIAIDPANGNVLVADSGNNRIEELTDTHGANPTKLRLFTSPQFNDPQGVAADAAGNIYVANTGANDVLVFSSTGTLLTTITDGFDDPGQIAVDPSGNIYVSDTLNDVIDVFGPIS